jgi:tetratricopeptide (TPR) repeat protein
MTRNAYLLIAASMWLLVALPARSDVNELQQSWSSILYGSQTGNREEALEMLADRARHEAAEHPSDAELLIWKGIILGSYANEKGGFGALSLAKEARASLERAIQLDERALMGSAHTSLGSLYYKVPGWPIGFGSDKQARKHLEHALSINPTGIDPNFFMGEFLLESGDFSGAGRYLRAALEAPDRPGRELADQGRRGEIRTLLARVEQHAR